MSLGYLLVLILMLPLPQQTDGRLDRLEDRMNRNEQDINGLRDSLDRQERRLNSIRPVCTADVRLVNDPEPRFVPPDPAAATPMNLASTVSLPERDCLPAEVQVAASYLDAAGNLVCSGVVENVALQSRANDMINLDIRPWNLQEFVRWRNEPPARNSGALRLSCLNPEGLTEASTEELARVDSVRVRATVLTPSSGFSTAEIEIHLQR